MENLKPNPMKQEKVLQFISMLNSLCFSLHDTWCDFVLDNLVNLE